MKVLAVLFVFAVIVLVLVAVTKALNWNPHRVPRKEKRQTARRLREAEATLHAIESAVYYDSDITGRLPIHTTVLEHVRTYHLNKKEIE